MSYMCIIAVEMACLPDFFNRVSAKEHITATFSLGALAKDCLATCAEAQEVNTGKRWPSACMLVYVVAPRHTHQRELHFVDCHLQLESNLALELHTSEITSSVLIVRAMRRPNLGAL